QQWQRPAPQPRRRWKVSSGTPFVNTSSASGAGEERAEPTERKERCQKHQGRRRAPFTLSDPPDCPSLALRFSGLGPKRQPVTDESRQGRDESWLGGEDFPQQRLIPRAIGEALGDPALFHCAKDSRHFRPRRYA